jgi:hypothetical protein
MKPSLWSYTLNNIVVGIIFHLFGNGYLEGGLNIGRISKASY